MSEYPRADPTLLEPFQKLNGSTEKITWDQRAALVRRTFPSVTWGDGEWVKAFDRDIELMGRILRDILKADQAVPGRPGPRPALDAARAQPRLDQMMGKDPTDTPYAVLPFAEAFTLLCAGRSVRSVAARVKLPRSQVQRLLTGQIVPSGAMMEAVAKGFGKNPAWFVEYRIGAVAAAIVHGLTNAPERSIRSYEALWAHGAPA